MLIPLDVAHDSGMISPGMTRSLLAPIRSCLSALRRGTWMPTERFAMRHVRDVIRLKSAGMPTREIARRMGTAPSTVRLMIRRFEAAGLTWPLPDDITDTELEARLFAGVGAGTSTRRGHRRQTEPDWAAVHRELKRKHVTLSIVWEEYIAGRTRRVSLFALLRALPRLGRPPVGDDAPVACGRRQTVRRLCGRRRASGNRPAHRRAARRADLRRGAR